MSYTQSIIPARSFLNGDRSDWFTSENPSTLLINIVPIVYPVITGIRLSNSEIQLEFASIASLPSVGDTIELILSTGVTFSFSVSNYSVIQSSPSNIVIFNTGRYILPNISALAATVVSFNVHPKYLKTITVFVYNELGDIVNGYTFNSNVDGLFEINLANLILGKAQPTLEYKDSIPFVNQYNADDFKFRVGYRGGTYSGNSNAPYSTILPQLFKFVKSAQQLLTETSSNLIDYVPNPFIAGYEAELLTRFKRKRYYTGYPNYFSYLKSEFVGTHNFIGNGGLTIPLDDTQSDGVHHIKFDDSWLDSNGCFWIEGCGVTPPPPVDPEPPYSKYIYFVFNGLKQVLAHQVTEVLANPVLEALNHGLDFSTLAEFEVARSTDGVNPVTGWVAASLIATLTPTITTGQYLIVRRLNNDYSDCYYSAISLQYKSGTLNPSISSGISTIKYEIAAEAMDNRFVLPKIDVNVNPTFHPVLSFTRVAVTGNILNTNVNYEVFSQNEYTGTTVSPTNQAFTYFTQEIGASLPGVILGVDTYFNTLFPALDTKVIVMQMTTAGTSWKPRVGNYAYEIDVNIGVGNELVAVYGEGQANNYKRELGGNYDNGMVNLSLNLGSGATATRFMNHKNAAFEALPALISFTSTSIEFGIQPIINFTFKADAIQTIGFAYPLTYMSQQVAGGRGGFMFEYDPTFGFYIQLWRQDFDTSFGVAPIIYNIIYGQTISNCLKYDAPNTISIVFKGCTGINPLLLDADDIQLYVNGIYVRPVSKGLIYSGTTWVTPTAPGTGTGSYRMYPNPTWGTGIGYQPTQYPSPTAAMNGKFKSVNLAFQTDDVDIILANNRFVMLNQYYYERSLTDLTPSMQTFLTGGNSIQVNYNSGSTASNSASGAYASTIEIRNPTGLAIAADSPIAFQL